MCEKEIQSERGQETQTFFQLHCTSVVLFHILQVLCKLLMKLKKCFWKRSDGFFHCLPLTKTFPFPYLCRSPCDPHLDAHVVTGGILRGQTSPVVPVGPEAGQAQHAALRDALPHGLVDLRGGPGLGRVLHDTWAVGAGAAGRLEPGDFPEGGVQEESRDL